MKSDFVQWLSNPSGLTPHGFCLLWEPGLLWLYAISDIAIGIAYLAIPFILLVFVRRRPDLILRPVAWLFAAFIILCGITHWLDVLTIWVSAYGVEAVFKAATGIVSLITAYTLWRLLPKALALPSPAQLRDANHALRINEARARASFESDAMPDGGSQVIEAHDGPDGLHILSSEVRVDLLVSDVGLPGLNGRQLADTARQTRPNLPVILITGYAGTSLDMRLAPGMVVLRKPFALTTLTKEARSLLTLPAEPAVPQRRQFRPRPRTVSFRPETAISPSLSVEGTALLL